MTMESMGTHVRNDPIVGLRTMKSQVEITRGGLSHVGSVYLDFALPPPMRVSEDFICQCLIPGAPESVEQIG